MPAAQSLRHTALSHVQRTFSHMQSNALSDSAASPPSNIIAGSTSQTDDGSSSQNSRGISPTFYSTIFPPTPSQSRQPYHLKMSTLTPLPTIFPQSGEFSVIKNMVWSLAVNIGSGTVVVWAVNCLVVREGRLVALTISIQAQHAAHNFPFPV